MSQADERACALVLELNERARAAWNAADWTAFGAVHASDLVVVDHRPASLGSMQGREAYIEAMRVMREMFAVTDTRTIEQHRVAPHGSVAHMAIWCVDDTESEFEVDIVNLNTVRGELMDRIEFFPVERLADALARLDELGRG